MRGPSKCPNCGYDPSGPDLEDDSEPVRSGGGWQHDHSVTGGTWTEELRCPTCGEVVAREQNRTDETRTHRGP